MAVLLGFQHSTIAVSLYSHPPSVFTVLLDVNDADDDDDDDDAPCPSSRYGHRPWARP